MRQPEENCCGEAKDLYVSDLFRKARRYVEAKNCPWFILSAEYGLVSPEQVIAPYEKTLNHMGVAERPALGSSSDRCNRTAFGIGRSHRIPGR